MEGITLIFTHHISTLSYPCVQAIFWPASQKIFLLPIALHEICSILFLYVKSPKTSIFNHFHKISRIQNYRADTHFCSKWKTCASPHILLLPIATHTGEGKKRSNILYSAVLSSSCNLTPEWWLHRCISTQSAFSAALPSPQHSAQLPTCLAAWELNGE